MKLFFQSRSIRHTAAGWIVALVCAAGAVIVYGWWQRRMTAREWAVARGDAVALERQLSGAERKLQEKRERLAAIDADNARLIDAISSGAISDVAVAAK